MPSTTSNSVCIVRDSSTVMTPSLPTLSIASAMSSPMVRSPFAEMGPTCAMASPLTGRAMRLISAVNRLLCHFCLLSLRINFSKTPHNAKSGSRLRRRLLAALLAAGRACALDDAEDFVLAHDQVLLAVNLYLRAAVLAEEHAVAGLNVQGDALAVVLALAVADGYDLALLRLLLRRVGH